MLLVQIKSSTSLAEISNALISGAGEEVSGKYSGLESGAANYDELKAMTTFPQLFIMDIGMSSGFKTIRKKGSKNFFGGGGYKCTSCNI